MEYFSSSRPIIPVDIFYSVLEKGFDYILPEYTINLINSISKKVGAPTYIKTPVFKKNVANKNKRRKKKSVDNEWVDVRTFKTPTSADENIVVKHEELILSSIKGFMNKLTAATYDDIRDSIFSSIKTLQEYLKSLRICFKYFSCQ